MKQNATNQIVLEKRVTDIGFLSNNELSQIPISEKKEFDNSTFNSISQHNLNNRHSPHRPSRSAHHIKVNHPNDKSIKNLHILANLYNISFAYKGADKQIYNISDNSIKKVLSAFNVKCGTDDEVIESIADYHNELWKRCLKKTIVEIEGYGSEIDIYIPSIYSSHISEIDLHILLEEGLSDEFIDQVFRDDILETIKRDNSGLIKKMPVKNISESIDEKTIDGIQYEHRVFKLSRQIPSGYHTIILRLPELNDENEAQNSELNTVVNAESDSELYEKMPNNKRIVKSHLIVTPEMAKMPEKQIHGFSHQFYSSHSKTSWGIGDFDDLRLLAYDLKINTNADFLLINPVHADHGSLPQTPSPYMPMSKRWLNPIYIRPEIIPEHIFSDNYSGEKSMRFVEKAAKMARALNNQSNTINRDAIWAIKKSALWSIFSLGISNERRIADFEDFKIKGGENLHNFATWCSLVDDYGFNASFQKLDPDHEKIIEYKNNNYESIEFYCWLQWIADNQLSEVQKSFEELNAIPGLICDLAVGSHKFGADVWINKNAYINGYSIGAPADIYNQKGQDWSLPPLSPQYLEETGYEIFHQQVRDIMRNCGAIRVDHMLGLFRLWFVPNNSHPTDGAYVHYNHDALIGILILEAKRQNCYIIGEDMGVIPDGAFDYIKNRGIMGTSVLWFERENDEIRDVKTLRRECLTSVTTHDIPPTIGFIEAEHIKLRSDLGILTQNANKLLEEHNKDLIRLRKFLINNNYLIPEYQYDSIQLSIALQKSLFDSPSLMIMFSIADFVGEYRTQNQPGTSDEYPNWRVPLEDDNGDLVFNDQLFSNPIFLKFYNNIKQLRVNDKEKNAIR